MIQADQPHIFGNDVIVRVSSKKDGNMKFGFESDKRTAENRAAFLHSVGVDPAKTVLVSVVYDGADNFCRYAVASSAMHGKGMLSPETSVVADALVTQVTECALFLPIADCCGVVLYDPVRCALMVSHIGRHSAVENGGAQSVMYLREQFSVDPKNLKVWLSPAVGYSSYPLEAFKGKGLHAVIKEQLSAAGVLPQNIEASRVDTAQDDDYFSHSNYVAGKTQDNGRFAVIAMMSP